MKKVVIIPELFEIAKKCKKDKNVNYTKPTVNNNNKNDKLAKFDFLCGGKNASNSDKTSNAA